VGGGTQTKPRSDVRGRSEMVSEVPRCQTVKTAVHRDAQLIDDSLWHVVRNNAVVLLSFCVQAVKCCVGWRVIVWSQNGTGAVHKAAV